jgi:hypothetical protein
LAAPILKGFWIFYTAIVSTLSIENLACGIV